MAASLEGVEPMAKQARKAKKIQSRRGVRAAALVVRRAEEPMPAVSGDNMVSVFATLARDARVDVQKLERLIGLQERILAHQARAAFTDAFLAMQAELPTIDARGRITDKAGKVQSRYSRYEDIADVIVPILTRHDFAIDFRTEFPTSDGKLIRTVGMLTHRSGHVKMSEFLSPADPSGSKNAIQGIGSTRSYGRRYTTLDLLNIRSRARVDRDDDGQATGAGEADGEFIEPPKPAQRKSAQPSADVIDVSPVAQSTAAPLPAIDRPASVGKIATLEPRGSGVLVTLDSGFIAATRHIEFIGALRRHEADGTTIDLSVRPSADPSRYAPVIEVIDVQKG